MMFFRSSCADCCKNSSKRLAFNKHTWFAIGLMVIGAASYWLFYAPILYGDDWSHIIGRWYGDSLKWFDWTERRPLLEAPILMLHAVFGLNLHAFYVVLWGLNVLAAIQLYFLMLRFMPDNAPLAFSVAALFLVYPADFTHMWLTMVGIRLVVVLTLLYAYLLVIYVDTGCRVALWIAIICLLLSFGIYEAQFGVAMAWGVLLFFLIKKTSSWRDRLGLWLPLILGLIFMFWRTIGYLLIGVNDNYLNRFQLTPLVLMERLILGYRVMVWAWLEPLVYAFYLNKWQAIIAFFLAVIICGFIGDVISRLCKLQRVTLKQKEHLALIRRFMWVMLTGGLFIAIGYIPVIAVDSPNLSPLGSRANIFAQFGAAVTIVALLATLILFRARRSSQLNFVVLTGMAPLFFWGVAAQARVQYDNRIAWEEQKQIWHELFSLAPDLKDKTVIYFILSGDTNEKPSFNPNGKRLPLDASWVATSALNVLYGKHDLRGEVFDQKLLFTADGFIRKKLFLKEGARNLWAETVTPYNQIIFMAYDGTPKRLRIIEDLRAEGLVDFPVPDYNPYKHIIQTPTTQTDLRWLVGVK
ncbi:MAG: hypothetical protein JW953_04025 [Anaerolineae bacterium]|nr:hypothetical protein [Anaerolineae bacterium]